MGGSVSIVKASRQNVVNTLSAYDGYVSTYPEGAELDYKLKKLGVSRAGAVALYEEFKRLDDIKTGDFTIEDICERLRTFDLSVSFMQRLFGSFNMETHERGSAVRLDADEFIFGVYYYAVLSRVELASFAFHLYDSDGGGELEEEELQFMFQDMFGASWENKYTLLMKGVGGGAPAATGGKDDPAKSTKTGTKRVAEPAMRLSLTYNQFVEEALGRVQLVLMPIFVLQQAFRRLIMTKSWWKKEAARVAERCRMYNVKTVRELLMSSKVEPAQWPIMKWDGSSVAVPVRGKFNIITPENNHVKPGRSPSVSGPSEAKIDYSPVSSPKKLPTKRVSASGGALLDPSTIGSTQTPVDPTGGVSFKRRSEGDGTFAQDVVIHRKMSTRRPSQGATTAAAVAALIANPIATSKHQRKNLAEAMVADKVVNTKTVQHTGGGGGHRLSLPMVEESNRMHHLPAAEANHLPHTSETHQVMRLERSDTQKRYMINPDGHFDLGSNRRASLKQTTPVAISAQNEQPSNSNSKVPAVSSATRRGSTKPAIPVTGLVHRSDIRRSTLHT